MENVEGWNKPIKTRRNSRATSRDFSFVFLSRLFLQLTYLYIRENGGEGKNHARHLYL